MARRSPRIGAALVLYELIERFPAVLDRPPGPIDGGGQPLRFADELIQPRFQSDPRLATLIRPEKISGEPAEHGADSRRKSYACSIIHVRLLNQVSYHATRTPILVVQRRIAF
jgi:hypothetical protein